MSFNRIVVRAAIAISLLVGVPSLSLAIYHGQQTRHWDEAYSNRLSMQETVPAELREAASSSTTSAFLEHKQHEKRTEMYAYIAVASIAGVWLIALVLLWVAKPKAAIRTEQ